MDASQALVLGGGGVAGVAWMTGLLTGLADAGEDVTEADLIIGTSAGASVAAMLGSRLPLAELFARQSDPGLQSAEFMVKLNVAKMTVEAAAYLRGATTAAEIQRRIGAYALAAETVPEATRRAVIESRLPLRDWPDRRIQVTAVDAATGDLAVFDAQSGVSLVDAVAASSAVPSVWPPVTIGGSRYIDGGVRSADNADLASGFRQITVISPLGFDRPTLSRPSLRDVVSRLRAEGSDVTVIVPDAASASAIGANPLDPATRTPAAKAGRAQGQTGLAANAVG